MEFINCVISLIIIKFISATKSKCDKTQAYNELGHLVEQKNLYLKLPNDS